MPIYTNLLNRDSDADGLNFWAGHIDKGNMTKEQAITQMIAGAKTNTSAQGIKDAALITNKNAVSKYFAETLNSDDVILAGKAFNGVTNDPETVTTSNAALKIGDEPQHPIPPKVKVGDTKVDDTKVGDTKAEEIKADKTKVEETKVEEIKVEEIKVIPVIVDDYAADIGTTGVINISGVINIKGSMTGTIETPNDKDWFKVNLIKNTEYSMVATGIGGDTPFLVLYDKQGFYINSDYQSVYETNALIKFTPTESGEYYLGFEDLFDKATGDYTIDLTGVAPDPLLAIMFEAGIL